MSKKIVNSRRRIEAATAAPPTTERGSETGDSGIIGWGTWAGGGDLLERVTELVWPQSPRTYRYMLNDAQINSLVLGLTLPIRSFRWFLEPNGAKPEVVDRISRDYNLPVGRETLDYNRRRGARRFSFAKHLEDALRALVYGHFFFEQVGEVAKQDGLWHLRKLGVRSPLTLTEINVARDGGLESIRQQTGPETQPIPVTALLAYVWDREGSNWTGRSMLRPIYRNHLVKDRVLRVGAINIERAGGVPYIEAPDGATGDQIRELDALARRFRVGEGAGAALPHGAQLKFAAAAGGDGAVNYIKLQNEEMARSFLQMIQVLGQTQTGSRALGSEFNDIAGIVQNTIAQWFADIFNEHMIEDDVEWNEGPAEEYAPLLSFESGAVDPMEGFDSAVGEDDGLSINPAGDVAAMLGLRTSGRARAMRRQQRPSAGAALASPVSLPPRPLRRQPYEHEVRAAVDFAVIDSTYESALMLLEQEVRQLQQYQIDQLHDAIVAAAGDLDDLAELECDPISAVVIATRLRAVSALAVSQAAAEASRQGVELTPPDASELDAAHDLRSEAVDRLLAQSLAQTASRNAVRLTGGSLAPEEVANDVRTYLRSLSGAYLRDILGGAIQQSINSGRKLVFNRDSEDGDLYASELLDSNTCSRCIGVDGRQYDTMESAERDYPTGGFKDCEGRERCRGTLVKVYKNETAPALQEPFGNA